ncbi:hypothetical protein Q5P01_010886 [Channa striata]|uniref:Scaffolding anchor of CK1 domain-containing protein n=1 Tax=Channa striata TaxID=64152 RepID=A0AA88SQ47_CHASR|nr:hypothetical protein Q5P01_010886 [Channa striata]
MDASSVSVLWYRRSKPLGKVRRRVQDLRIPSSYYNDFLSALDLSHNESARLAVDCLLSRGLEGYREVLNTEGEVDFLSELEKNYILKNGGDGNTDVTGASVEGDKDFETLSAGSWSGASPAVSTDGDSSVADIKWTDSVLDRPGVEIYFQCKSRAVGMKDLVREFIRKAKMALAIVMDSFSDVELLCDLLEASRKRNVSVYLLLDHVNLNLFSRMWQELKLNSKNFPKLLVRSVHGQTYCAKTGRKLTGQIAESFIIADWTEVFTGSYSFSWLSWQVHRSLAILIKGSAITPFHQEFHRLYFSSKPVPGFVTFITVPHFLPLNPTSHTTQNNNSDIFKPNSGQTKTMCHGTWAEDAQNPHTNAKMPLVSSQQGPDLEHNKGDDQHGAGTASQKHTKPPQLYPKPTASPGTQPNVPTEKPKHAADSASSLHDAQRYVESLEKNPSRIQSYSNPRGQTHISNVQSQLDSLTISTKAEMNPGLQKSNPLHVKNPTNGPLRMPSGNGKNPNTPSGQRNYSLNLKANMELPFDNSKLLSPPLLQQTQANMGLHSNVSSRYASGLVLSLGTKRHGQPPPQLHQTTDAPGFKSTLTGPHFRPQLQTESKLFLPGARANLHLQPHTSQQVKPCPKLNWMPQTQLPDPDP